MRHDSPRWGALAPDLLGEGGVQGPAGHIRVCEERGPATGREQTLSIVRARLAAMSDIGRRQLETRRQGRPCDLVSGAVSGTGPVLGLAKIEPRGLGVDRG